jgi:UDP-2-acetamido-3-amino-2,3-dideoxy-glucuronate N-acetyltransferase
MMKIQVHETAVVEKGAEIGPGSKIWHHAHVREGALIGEGVIIGMSVFVDSGVVIGSNCKIQNLAQLYARLTLEAGVFVGPGAIFANDKYPRAVRPGGGLKLDSDWVRGSTYVYSGASVGAGALILPGLKIGRGAIVGAGTVVTRDVPDYGMVVGNPGCLVGFVDDDGRLSKGPQ